MDVRTKEALLSQLDLLKLKADSFDKLILLEGKSTDKFMKNIQRNQRIYDNFKDIIKIL